MFFSTVVAPTVIFAATHDVGNLQWPQQRQRRHFAQEKLIHDFFSTAGSLLSPWQKIETIQPVQQELHMEYRESKKLQDLDSYATTVLSTKVTVPRTRRGSHSAQSDLVHRFASFVKQFSMTTSYAACQSDGESSSKPHLARWFKL